MLVKTTLWKIFKFFEECTEVTWAWRHVRATGSVPCIPHSRETLHIHTHPVSFTHWYNQLIVTSVKLRPTE